MRLQKLQIELIQGSGKRISPNPQSVQLKPNYISRGLSLFYAFFFSSRAKKGTREMTREKRRWRMEGKLIRDFPRPRGTRTEIENVRLVNPAVARNFLIPFSSRINGFPHARDPSKSPRRGLRNLASYSYGRDRSRFLPANVRSRESLIKTCMSYTSIRKKNYICTLNSLSRSRAKVCVEFSTKLFILKKSNY